jgi:Holliday junction resolvase
VRKAARVDANQEQIVSALRAAGATVQSLASVGKGCPDLLVSHDGSMYLMECKTGNKKQNAAQLEWERNWQSYVYVVRKADDALRVIGVLA